MTFFNMTYVGGEDEDDPFYGLIFWYEPDGTFRHLDAELDEEEAEALQGWLNGGRNEL
jgi:hypothetical protein